MVSQRMFRGGRTEYVRSPSSQTLQFLRAFGDPSVSVREPNAGFFGGFGCREEKRRSARNRFFVLVLQREAKVQMFREAVDAYAALTEQVSSVDSLSL